MECKRKTNMWVGKAQGQAFKAYEIPLESNPFNVEKIEFQPGPPAAVYLLAITKKITFDKDDVCECVVCKRKTADCDVDPEHFAHFYINSNSTDAFKEHYIIEFVDNNSIVDPKQKKDIDIKVKYKKFVKKLDKILFNTANRLNITNRSPFFHIFSFSIGDHLDGINIGTLKELIIDKLRINIGYTKDDKLICNVESVKKNSKTLVFCPQSRKEPFKLQVS